MMARMNGRFLMLVASVSLGIWACHGDTHLATDVNDTLLQDSTTPHTVGVTLQGTVTCAACDPAVGMAVVVQSPSLGTVANGLFSGVGTYSVSGVAKPGDALTLYMTVSKGPGLVSKSVSVTVPDKGGTLTQDFQF